MWALTIDDGALHYRQRETPVPGPRDVLVAVSAAGVNAADLAQLKGHYPAPPGWPQDVPGMELAGVVVAVGEALDESQVGRRVCALTGGGAQASHCVVPVEHLIEVPSGFDLVNAGGFPEIFSTAFDALVSQGEVARGERVVVSGAAGGVGVAAVQIAHALGAHVVAVTRDDRHHEALLRLGADELTTLEGVPALEPCDVVIELLGGAHLAAVQSRLAPFARVVVIGVGRGARVELDLLNVMVKRVRLRGSTLRSRGREEKAHVARLVSEVVVPWWTAGRVQVPFAAVFDLADGAAAYDFFARPGKFGKVICRVDPPA